jgi:hypothetical protein
MQLLQCPRRLSNQPQEEPASHHAWCHIACRGGLAIEVTRSALPTTQTLAGARIGCRRTLRLFCCLDCSTSIEMMAEIRRILINETRSRESLRGRYLDMDTFDNLAPVLDLRKLMRLDRP